MATLKKRVERLEQPSPEDYCDTCAIRILQAKLPTSPCPQCGAATPARMPISVARKILTRQVQ